MSISRPTRVALFGKPPVPGLVKTRLGASLGDAVAASLYRAFLLDAVAHARCLRGPITLFVDGDPAHPALEVVELPTWAQEGADLGERMAQCFARELAFGVPVLLAGTDVPTLPERVWHAAREALETHPQVYVPSVDGGYVLVGAREVPRFDGVRWSTRHALADTLAQNPDAAVIEPWYDVDDAEDLRLLRLELALRPSAAPTTAAYLARLG
ncbi:MAG: glycosyltransferase [Myxococcota bacterium]|nr:glycosyltransferase [Myxococcota bacterium]